VSAFAVGAKVMLLQRTMHLGKTPVAEKGPNVGAIIVGWKHEANQYCSR